MSRASSRFNLSKLLFTIFWKLIQFVNPLWSRGLMYWGLRDGAFPNTTVFDAALGTDVFGHHFDNPIGVASGIDAQGDVMDTLINIGFGFGEFGPYTLEEESPTQETYYLRREKAIVVQTLGYRNPGLLETLPTLINRRYLPHIIGINLAITVSEDENIKLNKLFTYVEEFTLMAQKVAPYCDYIVLDLSHPETELSTLVSDHATMVPLLRSVKEAVKQAAPIQTPALCVKIPLDVTPLEIPLVCQALMKAAVDGIIVAGPLSLFKNHQLNLGRKRFHAGMLSGHPVKARTTEVISKVFQYTNGKIPIIACGGVFTGGEAYEQIRAGASLIQIDAALSFEGPGVVSRISRELIKLLKQHGHRTVKEAVGADFF